MKQVEAGSKSHVASQQLGPLKRVLVTGGAGFIGSHLVASLLEQGYDTVRVLDNFSQGKRAWLPPAVEVLEGDIVCPEDCARACREVDGVVHLAAMSKSGPSFDLFEFCMTQNAVGTQNILAAAVAAGVKKLVYAASSTCYGNAPAPQQETSPLEFLNPYALSKYVGEQSALLFNRIYQLPVISLRLFNVYGPRQPDQGAYALVLGRFLERHKRGLALQIHGSGRQQRDFIHVRDVANAMILALESLERGHVLNVGSGSNVSVQEIADLIAPQHQVREPRRLGDAEVTLAEISEIQRVLGWEPSVSFSEGLKELMG